MIVAIMHNNINIVIMTCVRYCGAVFFYWRFQEKVYVIFHCYFFIQLATTFIGLLSQLELS